MAQKKEMTTSPDKSEPPMLKICTKCQLVHDDWGGWLTKKAYRDATGIDPVTCLLMPDYCPTCYEFFIQKLQEHKSWHKATPKNGFDQNLSLESGRNRIHSCV